jgi:hypothetical protein
MGVWPPVVGIAVFSAAAITLGSILGFSWLGPRNAESSPLSARITYCGALGFVLYLAAVGFVWPNPFTFGALLFAPSAVALLFGIVQPRRLSQSGVLRGYALVAVFLGIAAGVVIILNLKRLHDDGVLLAPSN